MTTTLRRLAIVIGAKTTDFDKEWNKVDRQILKSTRLLEDTGKRLTMGLTVPLLAIGAGAVKAALEYQNASSVIQRQTGASGEKLEQLNGSFQRLFTSVPFTSAQVATALGQLASRTGLTGQKLENLTRQMLNLAEVSGEQVPALIEATTRAFGDWSIATDQQSEALDYLFKASQETGVAVTRIAELAVQYGAPLRQMGFSWEQAAAMMAKFEKEGVNTELVMGSLRIGLVKLAKAGEDPPKAFQRIVAQIAAMGSAADANRLAVEVFGARAGPDMAAAIREGRFEIEGLMKQLSESGTTINGTAADTETLGERFKTLRNRAIDAAQPLGGVLLETLEGLVGVFESALTAASGFGKALFGLNPVVGDFVVGIGAALVIIGPTILAIAKMQQALRALDTAIKVLSGNPLVVAAMALIALGVVAARMSARVKADVEARAAQIEESMRKVAGAEKARALEAIEAEQAVVDAQVKGASAALRARLAGLDDEREARRDYLQERIKQVDTEHNAVIDAIREEYGVAALQSNSKTDLARRASQAVIDSLEAEASVARTLHDERMQQLDDQYRAKLKLLDDETRAAIEALDAEIRAIDEQTRQEDKALRRAQMEKAIAEEDDADRRAELRAELRRWDELEERDAQKTVLEMQKENIRLDAENKRAALETELALKQEAEGIKLGGELQRLADAKTAEEGALAEIIERIQLERIEKENAETAKYEASKKSLELQLEGLDEHYVLLKANLDAQVKDVEAAELAKNAALVNRLAADRKAFEEQWAWLDDETEVQKRALADAWTEYRTQQELAAATALYYQRAGSVDVAPTPIPGAARGGYVMEPGIVRVGELGPELLYLQPPAQVRPLDDSRSTVSDIKVEANYYVSDRGTAEYANADLMRKLRNLGVQPA